MGNPILPLIDNTKMTDLPNIKLKIDLAPHILVLALLNLVLSHLFGTSRYFQLGAYYFSTVRSRPTQWMTHIFFSNNYKTSRVEKSNLFPATIANVWLCSLNYKVSFFDTLNF